MNLRVHLPPKTGPDNHIWSESRSQDFQLDLSQVSQEPKYLGASSQRPGRELDQRQAAGSRTCGLIENAHIVNGTTAAAPGVGFEREHDINLCLHPTELKRTKTVLSIYPS